MSRPISFSERLRAVKYFGLAGALGSSVAAILLYGILGLLAALTAVVLATATAATSALILSAPLARARGANRWGVGALLGVGVTVLSYALFAFAYASFSSDEGLIHLDALRLILEVSLEILVFLAPIGAVAGGLYARSKDRQPLAE